MDFDFKILFYDPNNPGRCLLEHYTGGFNKCHTTAKELTYSEAAKLLKEETWKPAIGELPSGQPVKVMMNEISFKVPIFSFEEIGPLTRDKFGEADIYIMHHSKSIYRIFRGHNDLRVQTLMGQTVCTVITLNPDYAVCYVDRSLFGRNASFETTIEYRDFVIVTLS